ncbi:phosphotransferase [Halomarina oriensis]|uniref:Phosphotransferase n=2 Tax=Halomarina oriensis TaxID=671145 RepID=A0A6B0GEP5_9EURY|nr:phosphotransferase [Halomarina oriensis]
MVGELEPTWTVESIERSEHGTDFVGLLTVDTGDERRRVVLKATTAGLVDPAVARSEPRLLDLVDRETAIPVPSVVGYRDDHGTYPAPFTLMEYVDGENLENRAGSLAPAARDRIVRDAGANLARLHALGPLPAYGRVGVEDGELTVLDTDDHSHREDFREKLLADTEETLDSLTDGGFFPELADDPERFADLVPDARAFVREAVPALPEADPPTYNHWDYRYGNLLVDPETGETRAVLDWANLSAADPAYNLAKVETRLLSPEDDGETRTADLRETFRSAYRRERPSWTFDDATLERMALYRLTDRLDAMACLPLWYQDASPKERDDVAADHRAFVHEFF